MLIEMVRATDLLVNPGFSYKLLLSSTGIGPSLSKDQFDIEHPSPSSTDRFCSTFFRLEFTASHAAAYEFVLTSMFQVEIMCWTGVTALCFGIFVLSHPPSPFLIAFSV